ncbi:hypothetical protein Leryth_022117 [Lithospermum erythrorhizon]|nr:hypothetical protein Leryth_022117 [Lithospermum erythrorhizon]
MIKLSSSCFMFYLFIIFYVTFTSADLDSDRSALVALRSAVRGRLLSWNVTESSPCNWVGVTCSPDFSYVTELRFPGMGLTGNIPPNTISNLTRLSTLSLRYNLLTSPLPSDISKLTELRNIYLQHNLFTGPVPDEIYSLTSLVRLNLAHNGFSGQISDSLNSLTRLGTLYLQNNNFSGSIPDLNLPGLVQFNVSFNNLTGRIPDRLSGNSRDSFLGNELCGRPLELCEGEQEGGVDEDQGGGDDKGLSGGAIAGIVIGCVVGALLIIFVLFLCCRKRGKKDVGATREVASKDDGIEVPGQQDVEGGERESAVPAAVGLARKERVDTNVASGKKGLVYFGQTGWSFDLEDLLKASAEVLGKGTFGTAYKAILETGTMVAVKRLKDVLVPERQFRDKMEEIGRMNHENLVPLRAYYYSRDEKLLVYDYMPMGSLSALLHGNKGSGRTPLNWESRASIALGAARGISYLHEQGPSVSHGNIKSSNVLLTKSFEARVSDFGLAQIGPGSPSNRVAGYQAPEVTDLHKVSQKADVFSFGVLVLELLTGKAPTHALLSEEGVDLPRWVHSVCSEEWTSDVFDLELLRYQNAGEEDMVQLLQLALDCTAYHPDNRPSMAEVLKRIEELCSSMHVEQEDIVNIDDDQSV